MGYACPVCETPQRDGEHLAHHLAFTAMLHGDDHETWLDEHVPDWSGRDPPGLAEAVTEHAAEAEYHEVFEDTVDRSPGRPDVASGSHDHDHGHGHDHGHDHGQAADSRTPLRDSDPSELDPEAAAAVREARELTREMYADGADGADEEGVADPDETDEARGADGTVDSTATDATDATDDRPDP